MTTVQIDGHLTFAIRRSLTDKSSLSSIELGSGAVGHVGLVRVGAVQTSFQVHLRGVNTPALGPTWKCTIMKGDPLSSLQVLYSLSLQKGVVSQALSVNLSDLKVGSHRIFIRVQSPAGIIGTAEFRVYVCFDFPQYPWGYTGFASAPSGATDYPKNYTSAWTIAGQSKDKVGAISPQAVQLAVIQFAMEAVSGISDPKLGIRAIHEKVFGLGQFAGAASLPLQLVVPSGKYIKDDIEDPSVTSFPIVDQFTTIECLKSPTSPGWSFIPWALSQAGRTQAFAGGNRAYPWQVSTTKLSKVLALVAGHEVQGGVADATAVFAAVAGSVGLATRLLLVAGLPKIALSSPFKGGDPKSKLPVVGSEIHFMPVWPFGGKGWTAGGMPGLMSSGLGAAAKLNKDSPNSNLWKFYLLAVHEKEVSPASAHIPTLVAFSLGSPPKLAKVWDCYGRWPQVSKFPVWSAVPIQDGSISTSNGAATMSAETAQIFVAPYDWIYACHLAFEVVNGEPA